MWAGKLGGQATPRERWHADRTRFRPERGSVIELHAALVLPLMHHFVHQCSKRLIEAVSRDVIAADDDLGRIARLAGGGVVAESRSHPAGDSHVEGTQLTVEALGIESRVMLAKLRVERGVRWMRRLTAAARRWRLDLEAEQRSPGTR